MSVSWVTIICTLAMLMIGTPSMAQDKCGDVTIEDLLFHQLVINNGSVDPRVRSTDNYLESYIDQLSFRWNSPSSLYYTFDFVVQDSSILEMKLSIPRAGRLSPVWQPFVVNFGCIQAGQTYLNTLVGFSPPEVRMPTLRFLKKCASPCKMSTNPLVPSCTGHGTLKNSTYGGYECVCNAPYQQACCSHGLWTNVTNMCVGQPLVIFFDITGAKLSDVIYVTRASPARNSTAPWSGVELANRQALEPEATVQTISITSTYRTGSSSTTALNKASVTTTVYDTTYGIWSVAYVDTSDYVDRFRAVSSFNLLPPSSPICLRQALASMGLDTNVDVEQASFKLQCANGVWDATARVCVCYTGFYGLLCEHGCAALTNLTLPSMTGISNDAAGSRMYANGARCAWRIAPTSVNHGIGELVSSQPRAIGAIQIHFSFLNTATDLDDSGLNPLDRVIISDGNGTIYRTLYGYHSFVESIVIRGGVVQVDFITDSTNPSWAQTNATATAGFTFSYNTIECMSGLDLTQQGQCMTCPRLALSNYVDGSLNEEAVTFLCHGCSASTFTLLSGDAERSAGCVPCGTVSHPEQPEFMQCIDDWPPASVDLSASAQSGALAVVGLLAAIVVICMAIIGYLHYRANRVVYYSNPMGLYLIGIGLLLTLCAAALQVANQTDQLCNGKIALLVIGAQLLMGTFSWQVYRTNALMVDNTPVARTKDEDLTDEERKAAKAKAIATAVPDSPLASPLSSPYDTKEMKQSRNLLGGSSHVSDSGTGDEVMVDNQPIKSNTNASGASVTIDAPVALLPIEQTFNSKLVGLLIVGIPLAIDIVLVILFWSFTPMHIQSTYRRECQFPKDDAGHAGAILLSVLMGLTKLPLFIYCMVIWTRVSKLPSSMNEARFVGLIMADSLLVAIICIAVVQGFGSRLADGGSAALVTCFSLSWVLAVAIALVFGHRLFFVLRGKHRRTAYSAVVKKRAADIATSLPKVTYNSGAGDKAQAETSQLLLSTEAVLARLQATLDTQMADVDGKKARQEQLKVASYIVQKMIDNPEDVANLLSKSPQSHADPSST